MTSAPHVHLGVIPLPNVVLSLDISVVRAHLASGEIMRHGAHIIHNDPILEHLSYVGVVLEALEIVVVVVAAVVELGGGSWPFLLLGVQLLTP